MKRISTAMLLMTLAGPLNAQLRSNTEYAVTQHQVYGMIHEALMRVGIPVDRLDVKLLTDVKTSVAETQLHVLGVSYLSGRSGSDGRRLLAVRMACHNLTLCLPFYVIAEVSSRPADSGSDAALTRVFLAESPSPEKEVPLIAKGKQITLELQQAGMHIQMPAITLQSGVQGQSIRVESLNPRHAYTAIVVDANLVRGDF